MLMIQKETFCKNNTAFLNLIEITLQPIRAFRVLNLHFKKKSPVEVVHAFRISKNVKITLTDVCVCVGTHFQTLP